MIKFAPGQEWQSDRLSKEVPFSEKSKAFGEAKFAYETLASMKYKLGRKLDFDKTKEMFLKEAEANALVSRPYREGFASSAQSIIKYGVKCQKA